MQISRILTHGKIETLKEGFRLPHNSIFSVYVRPKEGIVETDLLVNCRCICDDKPSDLPVPLNEWTPAAIVEITPNAIELDMYDVYWGAGNTNY